MENVLQRWQGVEIACDRLVVWGASDQFRVNYPILKSCGCRIEALVDDTPGLLSPIDGIPLLRGEKGLDVFLKDALKQGLGFVIAIGNPHGDARMRLHRLLLDKGLTAISFADPTALVCRSATFGAGLQVMPGAIVHNEVRIGRQCIVNTRAIVEHDCILEDGVEIAPGAVLCGRVHVGENSWIGANATISPRLTIGDNSIVGAGAVVISDIPEGSVAVGVPARVISRNKARR